MGSCPVLCGGAIATPWSGTCQRPRGSRTFPKNLASDAMFFFSPLRECDRETVHGRAKRSSLAQCGGGGFPAAVSEFIGAGDRQATPARSGALAVKLGCWGGADLRSCANPRSQAVRQSQAQQYPNTPT